MQNLAFVTTKVFCLQVHRQRRGASTNFRHLMAFQKISLRSSSLYQINILLSLHNSITGASFQSDLPSDSYRRWIRLVIELPLSVNSYSLNYLHNYKDNLLILHIEHPTLVSMPSDTMWISVTSWQASSPQHRLRVSGHLGLLQVTGWGKGDSFQENLKALQNENMFNQDWLSLN